MIRNKGKQSIFSGDDSTNVIAGGDINILIGRDIPTDLIDHVIEEETEKLRKSRFFCEFDRKSSSINLARRITKGDLSAGSNGIKGKGLAWCARILSSPDEIERAEGILQSVKALGVVPELKIAYAFVISQKGNKVEALQTLADIGSDASRSAALMIVAHHEGAEGAVTWLAEAGCTADNLDSDGKCFLLSQELQLSYWDDAAQTLEVLSENDFTTTPMLLQLAALATLVPAVPLELRAIVMTQVPFEARGFPLASDTSGMDSRRAARKLFLDAAEIADKLSCHHSARMDDEYALWLELQDPTQSEHGKNRLRKKLQDGELGFINYAFQFGIKLDLDKIERDINRSIALHGGITTDAAIARFTLALTQPTPEEVADYIDRYHNQLAPHIDSKLMRYRQIEMLSRAGLTERANQVLNHLLEEGIPSEQEANLRRIISESQGCDPVESLKSQFEKTEALTDLINLVAELEIHKQWNDLCEYGRRLFEETHFLNNAERLVNAFNNTNRFTELVEFLNENKGFLLQSKHLGMSYAWGLYYEGAFLESYTTLAELSDEADSPNYRALRVNLGIATGDWASLNTYITDEYHNKENRSARDLIGAGQMALYLGSPHAKDLVFEAVKKADADSNVLAAAYFVAASAGWEHDPQVFEWLEKAAEMSGDDGPLQRLSLKDIIDQKPEWDRRESETWNLLEQGQVPIFLAAQSLNRSVIDLTIFRALANLTESDPRRQKAIPSFSGQRIASDFQVSDKTVALDATALLTLSFLKIIDIALDAFKMVFIPHSTLSWLFEERQKTVFHQPSLIRNARIIRDFLSTEMLEKFTPSTTANSELSDQVGDELAALIAEAEKLLADGHRQQIVVRSAPVHRLSSLMEEEADLSEHAAVLSSCLAVVEKLRQKGAITADDEKRARTYLRLHEKPWQNQPDIEDGATLYLDDLAISYFMHLGLLGKIKGAGLKAVASPRTVTETATLISYKRISEEVIDVIERIRASLYERIRSGQVKVGRRHNFDKLDEKSLPEHPSAEILNLAPNCDVCIIDDRFLNKHQKIDYGGLQTPVFSTIDLLNSLLSAGVLSIDDHLEYRTRLRQAGHMLIPVTEEELERCLRESPFSDDHLDETAELKAIREAVLRVRMSNLLQLPRETPWLDGTLKVFVRVLKKLWANDADIEKTIAYSNWLVEQIDIRGWAQSLIPENADNIVRVGRAAHMLLILTLPVNVHKKNVTAYWEWVEGKILVPTKEQFPMVYERIVNYYRSYIAEVVSAKHSKRGKC